MLQPALARSVVLVNHPRQKRLVVSERVEIAAATQQQGLLNPPLEMAMRALHTAVFMRHAQVVAAVGQAVVAAEGVVPRGEVGAETAVTVPARCR